MGFWDLQQKYYDLILIFLIFYGNFNFDLVPFVMVAVVFVDSQNCVTILAEVIIPHSILCLKTVISLSNPD